MLTIEQRPRDRKAAAALFGDPAGGDPAANAVDPAWEKANIVELHGRDAIPGLERWYFHTHRLMEPIMRAAFAGANAACPGYINRAASFVFRRVRHGAETPLSYHAFGIAVDVNPSDNSGRWISRPPVPWSDAWYKLWPMGVPRGVVEAFEDQGFSWGGLWRGYVDPMHFEWVG